MFEKLIDLVESAVRAGGYPAVVVLMALGTACIPIPSEVVLFLAGAMVSKSQLNFHVVAMLATLGCVIGSLIAYWAGLKGGRPFLKKYGKYVLLKETEIDRADRWFAKYGQSAVFIGRLVPLVRAFVSLPAGIYRMKLIPFLILTFVGSAIWCYALLYVGYQFQENRELLSRYFTYVDYVVVFLIAVGITFWILKKRRRAIGAT